MNNTSEIARQPMESPLGPLWVSADERGVTAVAFADERPLPAAEGTEPASKIVQAALAQLGEYFAGRRQAFTVPLAARGTEFQAAVWGALCELPFGATASYQDIAVKIHNPKAVRAVGAANGRNPIAIIVPCHRVIGANGTLTGYAGGLARKQWLLRHEGLDLSEAAGGQGTLNF